MAHFQGWGGPLQLLIPILRKREKKKILMLTVSQSYYENNSGHKYIHLKLGSRVSVFHSISPLPQILAKELV